MSIRPQTSLHMYLRSILLCVGVILLDFPFVTGFEGRTPSARFERIGPYGGDVRSLLLDSRNPDVAYLGTSSGRIFKSLDSGKTWNVLHPGIGSHEYVIDTLVQHPREGAHIYAGAWDLHSEGGGLFESRNGGETWSRIPVGEGAVAVRGFDICGKSPDHMIAGTLQGAYVSSDGGRVWKRVGAQEFQKVESVAIDPVNPGILYAGTWRLGYKSSDFGSTWTLVNRGMPLDSDVFSISVHRRNPEIVYASACSGVFRSSNGARSWTHLRVHPRRLTVRAHVVYIDPVDSRRIYSGTTEGLFVSPNDGQTWTRLTRENVTVNAVQVDPRDNRRILIGTEYQGLLASEDGGRTWKESNTGFVHRKISWMIADPRASEGFLAGLLSGAGGLYRYDNRDHNWELSQIAPGTRILSCLILPDGKGSLAGTSQGLFWLPGGSRVWKKMPGSIARRTIYSLEMDSAGPVLYAGTDQGIYRTSLSVMDFRMPPSYRFSPVVWCLHAPRTSPGVVYAGTSLGVLRSRDKGTTWNVISAYGLPARTPIESIAVSPSDKEYLLAGTSAGLFESRNGGVHWRQVGDGMIGAAVSSVIFLDEAGKRILAADKTAGGLFHSDTGGASWHRISALSYESPVYCLLRDPLKPSVVYMGTRSDGVYRVELN
jgi:photosystem II stability/assembly factor-like uncharacterized protein